MSFFNRKPKEKEGKDIPKILTEEEIKIKSLLETIKTKYGTRKFQNEYQKPIVFSKDNLDLTITQFYGNDINEINAHWDSPIGFLIENNHKENFKFSREDIYFLLKHCDINVRNNQGESIAMLLFKNNQEQKLNLSSEQIMDLLKKADFSNSDNNHQTTFGILLKKNQELNLPLDYIQKMATKTIEQFFEYKKPIEKDILEYFMKNPELITKDIVQKIMDNRKGLTNYQKETYDINYENFLMEVKKINPQIILEIQKEQVTKKVIDCISQYRASDISETKEMKHGI
jgi:hypothetical protein